MLNRRRCLSGNICCFVTIDEAEMKKTKRIKPAYEAKITAEMLRAAARPNLEVAIDSIEASKDREWLQGFRARMIPAGESEIVAAIDKRLSELDELAFRRSIDSITKGLTLIERVREAVRVYEAFLARKHGKNIRASRTNAMIKRWGEKEAVIRTVTNMDMSNGLELLARYGRLDCSYEQIILDFPHEFEESLQMKARANLSTLPIQPL
jgi:hypothetical protein